jgi:hypothetical protein
MPTCQKPGASAGNMRKGGHPRYSAAMPERLLPKAFKPDEKPLIIKKRAKKVFPVRKMFVPLRAITKRGVYHRHQFVSLTFKDISKK